MKRRGFLLTLLVLLMGLLTACGSANATTEPGSVKEKDNKNKLQVVTTIFPEYDWVQNVLGENPAEAEVTMLLDNGVDLHSYQPSAEDIMKISVCDLFIYVGGESDKWVQDALKEATNKNMIVINLLEVLGDSVKEEEVVEGMQEDEHDHEDADHDEDGHEDADHDEGGHHHEELEYDEHVWLSLRNAEKLVSTISDAMKKCDPDHADVYEKNTKSYLERLEKLDGEYRKVVEAASVKTLLFGDRFPFRYFTDDYDLDYYAAFVGCSAETEASFETVIFLADKVNELSLHAVMAIEGTDHRIAETIVNNTNTKDQKILTLDSMQSTSMKDAQNGITYLSVMEKNLEVLKEALQ